MNKSRTVLITGCSSGFGHEMVTVFLNHGWTVLATLRRANDRREIFNKELEIYGERLCVLELDVTSSSDRRDVLEALESRGEKLDCLVNNAGQMLLGALEDLSDEQLRQQMEVNFFAVASMMREFLPVLRRSKGTIINVSSIFGFTTWPLTSAYCASKYAVEGLTQSVGQELEEHGVKVALIQPGSHSGTLLNESAIWGKFSNETDGPYAAQTHGYRAFRSKLSKRERGAPIDVAEVALQIAESSSPPLRTQVGSAVWAMDKIGRFFPEWLNYKMMGNLARRTFRKEVDES